MDSQGEVWMDGQGEGWLDGQAEGRMDGQSLVKASAGPMGTPQLGGLLG